jgi:alanine racemase
MTHFADADGPPGVAVPLARFRHALPQGPVACSLANSAAIIDHPLTHAEWVRPGIMLYGASPFAGRSASALGLQPAMHFESRLIGVQSLATGDAVGYGSSFVADRPMRIGVVACGYADGYPRHAGTGTPVAVAGVRTRTVGRVSMDMLTVDLTPIPDAGPGDPVELWGAQVPIDEVAACAGTIGYELMCAIAPRVAVLVED